MTSPFIQNRMEEKRNSNLFVFFFHFMPGNIYPEQELEI